MLPEKEEPMAQDLFTLATLGTSAGATAATLVVGNTLQSVFNLSAKWLSFAMAELIMILVVVFTSATDISGYFLAILIGCLVYCSAVGLNTMTSRPLPSEPPVARSAGGAGLPPRRAVYSAGFFGRWW
jgi:hypothetical protein